MAFSDIKQWWLAPFEKDCSLRFHRQILLVEGDADAGVALLQKLVACLPAHIQSCSVGNIEVDASLQKPVQLYRQLLGNSFHVGIYNGHEEFRPSALLALAGTLSHGGRLVILCPPLSQWAHYRNAAQRRFLSYGYTLVHSAYIERMTTLLKTHSFVARVGDCLHLPPPAEVAVFDTAIPSPFKSAEQANVFDLIMEQLDLGKSALVTAKRGRGKTSLMGLLCAALIRSGKKVLITSSARSSVLGMFERLREQLPHARLLSSFNIHYTDTGGSAQWLAPDHPGLTSYESDLLVVDEAASLPVPQLNALVASHRQVLLGTTVNGYEGSGQGFINRFIPDLKNHRALVHFSLSEPIRWHLDDAIEPLLEKILLFDAPQASSLSPALEGEPQFGIQTLAKLKEPQQNEVMALLNTAHYQTTPDDMMRLLDAPDCTCALIKLNDYIVGAAIINAEGGERLTPIAHDIACGKRRVKGHLSAQGIAYFSTLPECATFTYWRINRIAIVHSLQGKGLGTKLIAFIKNQARQQNIDLLTSSFGASSPLIEFWNKSGFCTIKIGSKADKASGRASALVAHLLNSQLTHTFKLLQCLGVAESQTQNISKAIAKVAFNETPPLNARELQKIRQIHFTRLEQFARGERHISHSLGSLNWLLKQSLNFAELAENKVLHAFLTATKEEQLTTRKHQHGLKDRISELRIATRTLLASGLQKK